tara:strand:- start:2991 stop:3332 length:342 start_codon:yes stop_codon:yes gene_type:complete
MTYWYITVTLSLLGNIFLLWYVVRLLKKFFFISAHIADLFLINKAFQVFVKGMYSMENYHGEPMIQELVYRINEVTEEMENFRDIFEYTLDEELDEELEEELNGNEEDTQEAN